MSKCLRVSALVFLLAVSAFGQQLTSVSGTVTDPTGAVIPGAVLSLENLERGGKRETVSDSAGRYAFPQVQPDRYKITGKAQGFGDVVIEVQLAVATPASINVHFEKVGTVAEAVSVAADAAIVSVSDASLGNAIGGQAIMQLPFFARNVAFLLAFQPGVTAFNGTDDYRNGAVNGGKSDQANVTLDGIDVNDQLERYAFNSVLRVTLDSVQEFRTITTGANAEYGRGSGAQITLVTKNGTNDIHGSLYEYHRNTVHSANDFFNNLSGVKRPALLINVFGGSVGAPIKKDKMFYFLNYEGRRDASAANVARTVPSALMRQGIVQYLNTAGGVSQVGPAEIRSRIDPAGIGVNQAALQLMQTYPQPNDFTLGDGLNIVGYRFTAPIRGKQDNYTARFDYTLNSKHTLFWRGNLQNDRSNGVPQFPGDPPLSVLLQNTKGHALGHTAVLTPSLVSTFRYGQTRQSIESTGIQVASAVTFRNLTPRFGLSRGITRQIPVHHFTEDFAWTRGAHDIRFGGTMRWIANPSNSFANSFHGAVANLSWLRGTGADLQTGITDLDSRGRVGYGDAMLAVLGIITQGNAVYNYDIKGAVIPSGAPTARQFNNEEFEMYGQDAWKIRSNLTVTYGIRWSLMPPIYEANGVQTSANISLGQWFNTRAGLGLQGRSQKEAGLIGYGLHNATGGRPLYAYHKKNLAPRVSLVYSPSASDGWRRWLFGGPGKTTIRAGWGMYYDLFGQSLARSFDASAFGFVSRLTNPAGQVTSATAPRFAGFYSLPSALIRPPAPGGFPVQHPTSGLGSFAITNSIDDTIQPPYTINMNYSIAREFGRGLFIQGSYVGRLSRKSLITRDLAMPTNLVDPQSGMDYFTAATQLALHVRARTPVAQVGRIPFWENFYSNAAGGGLTATQAAYNVWRQYPNDDSSGLADIDAFDDPACLRPGCNMMFSSQFSALSALSSVAGGNFHSMQWTLRKRFGQGLLFDFNYAWAKSIDMSSTVERNGSYAGFLLNPFSPDQRVAVSDYDTVHGYNAFGVWELPFGKGKRFAGGARRGLDAAIGGWQLTGTWRQSTELPTSVSNGRNWPTNWNVFGFATPTGTPPVSTKTKNAPAVAGRPGPNMYADPNAGRNAWGFTLPGQSGSRNTLRVDGTFVVNTGVSKRIAMPYSESHSVQFRWEVFNVANSVRFEGVNLNLGDIGSFGKYTSTLFRPREMQFALRYEF